jgi:hypothetical protein
MIDLLSCSAAGMPDGTLADPEVSCSGAGGRLTPREGGKVRRDGQAGIGGNGSRRSAGPQPRLMTRQATAAHHGWIGGRRRRW